MYTQKASYSLPFTNGNIELIFAPVGTWRCDSIIVLILGKGNIIHDTVSQI